jgi:hypothetical protein
MAEPNTATAAGHETLETDPGKQPEQGTAESREGGLQQEGGEEQGGATRNTADTMEISPQDDDADELPQELAFANADWEYWKSETVPLLYDWFSHRNLEWPSSSARWGPVVKRYSDKVVQRLFYGERTGETDYLNTLVIAKVEIPYGGFTDRQSLGNFANGTAADPQRHSGSMQCEKRILHPGEVNTLRRCHQRSSVVCTHSDTSTVYVWDTDSAPHAAQNKRCAALLTHPASARLCESLVPPRNRRKVGSAGERPVQPTLSLIGHERTAQFALDCSPVTAHVLSGGQDALVLVWSLDDAASGSTRPQENMVRAKLSLGSGVGGGISCVSRRIYCYRRGNVPMYSHFLRAGSVSCSRLCAQH